MTEYLHEVEHILMDPAHLTVEFMFVLVDVVIISWVKNNIIKHIHRDVKAGKHRKP